MSIFLTNNVFIIAEAGVNHNGSVDMACSLIDVAVDAGADAVKFQTFRAKDIITCHAPKADYQLSTTNEKESHLDMVSRLELSEHDHVTLIAHAKKKGISFLSTPFDSLSLQMLIQRFSMEIIKISSGDITNAPLLLELGISGRRTILSTGMSTLGEVETALGILAFGYTDKGKSSPCEQAFISSFLSETGQAALHRHVSLLHCTTEYPAPYIDVNLKAMDTIKRAFGLKVGLSDHTPGIHVPIAAVARGAQIIEKHFTLDRSLIGPDHAASLEPEELMNMVKAIRDVEVAIGDGIKRPAPSELMNRDVARRSLVAARPIKTGKVIEQEDLAVKRPGTGVSPLHFWDKVGETAERNYMVDEVIDS